MVDPVLLYAVLRGVARRKELISYADLSRLYQEGGGDWQEPAGWGGALAELNGRARAAGLPPLSALVTSRPREGEGFVPPVGAGFWDSPGVPPRPARVDDRLMIWMGFVNLAYRAAWPEGLPGAD